jgi:hypothetical protein
MNKDPTTQKVLSLVGLPFLAYIANSSERNIETWINGDRSKFDGPQQAALIEALRLALEWAQPPQPNAPPARPDGEPSDRMRRFAWFDLDAKQSRANMLRGHAGGVLPVPSESLDPVERALVTMAIDYFPVTLIPRPRPDEPFGETPVVAHQRVDAFAEAVTSDKDLAVLFENGQTLYTSAGFGLEAPDAGRVTICILANAEQQVRFFQQKEPTAFTEACLGGLRSMRELCRSGEAVVPAQIGFGNVEVPAGIDIRGPRDGRIRVSTESDLRLSPAARASVVLDTTSPVALHFGAVPPEGGKLFDAIEALSRDSQLVTLAGLLVRSPGEEPILLLETWGKTFDPFQPYVGSFSGTRNPALTPTVLDTAETAALEKWIQCLEAQYRPTLRVAIRRCISAFIERSTPEDALIDLVIALEALFGARGELRLRISAALAWLLGEDAEERAALQSRAKLVYDVRSKIVHGAELKENEASQAEVHAKDLLLRALATLFTDRTDLIADQNRANRLILNR